MPISEEGRAVQMVPAPPLGKLQAQEGQTYGHHEESQTFLSQVGDNTPSTIAPVQAGAASPALEIFKWDLPQLAEIPLRQVHYLSYPELIAGSLVLLKGASNTLVDTSHLRYLALGYALKVALASRPNPDLLSPGAKSWGYLSPVIIFVTTQLEEVARGVKSWQEGNGGGELPGNFQVWDVSDLIGGFLNYEGLARGAAKETKSSLSWLAGDRISTKELVQFFRPKLNSLIREVKTHYENRPILVIVDLLDGAAAHDIIELYSSQSAAKLAATIALIEFFREEFSSLKTLPVKPSNGVDPVQRFPFTPNGEESRDSSDGALVTIMALDLERDPGPEVDNKAGMARADNSAIPYYEKERSHHFTSTFQKSKLWEDAFGKWLNREADTIIQLDPKEEAKSAELQVKCVKQRLGHPFKTYVLTSRLTNFGWWWVHPNILWSTGESLGMAGQLQDSSQDNLGVAGQPQDSPQDNCEESLAVARQPQDNLAVAGQSQDSPQDSLAVVLPPQDNNLLEPQEIDSSDYLPTGPLLNREFIGEVPKAEPNELELRAISRKLSQGEVKVIQLLGAEYNVNFGLRGIDLNGQIPLSRSRLYAILDQLKKRGLVAKEAAKDEPYIITSLGVKVAAILNESK
jgi:DNA-binding MarR family transcriptional regulator